MKSKIYLVVIAVIVLTAIGVQAAKPDGNDCVDDWLCQKIIEMQSNLRPARPIRPDQLDLEDIHAGDILFEVNKAGGYKVLIVKSPYMVDGDCKYNYVFWENGAPSGEFIWSGCCSDMGLVEYTGTFYGWNPSNYFKRTDETSLTPEQIEDAIKNMRPEPGTELEPVLEDKSL